jgi:hypothetical protein
MDEFLELLKATATDQAVEGMSREALEPLVGKINELVTQNKKSLDTSQAVLASLSSIDNRLKRLYIGSAPAAPPAVVPRRF